MLGVHGWCKHALSLLPIQILAPFMLRRLKSDVDLVIPPKRELLVYAPLTPLQHEMYRSVVDRTIESLINKQDKVCLTDCKPWRLCHIVTRLLGFFSNLAI